LARSASDAKQARRWIPTAGVADGLSRRDATAIGLMDRPTLRDWVRRINEQGPQNLSIPFLPPHLPVLNPTENLWQHLRQTHVSNRVFETRGATVDACCDAENRLTAKSGRIKSIAIRIWATTAQ